MESVINTIINRIFQKKDKNSEDNILIRDTISWILYTSLSDKLDRVLAQGEITAAQRHEIEMLHKIYKRWGFNGDMDTRMEMMSHLPTVSAAYIRKEK